MAIKPRKISEEHILGILMLPGLCCITKRRVVDIEFVVVWKLMKRGEVR